MTYKILTLDGGGVRGFLQLHILKEQNIDTTQFQLYCGTSIGGFIAAALLLGNTIDDLLADFDETVSDVFGEKKDFWAKMFGAQYDLKPLVTRMKDKYGFAGITLGSLPNGKRLCLTAVNANTFENVLFDSADEEYSSVLLTDAVLASMSAPTYFKPTQVNGQQMADGGLFANDPTSLAMVCALQSAPLSELDIVSIGSGFVQKTHKNEWLRDCLSFVSGGYLDWGVRAGTVGLDKVYSQLQDRSDLIFTKLRQNVSIKRLNIRLPAEIALDDHTAVRAAWDPAQITNSYDAE